MDISILNYSKVTPEVVSVGYIAEENGSNAAVLQQIELRQILNFIVDTQLNLMPFDNGSCATEVVLNPLDVFNENTLDILTRFLKSNLN